MHLQDKAGSGDFPAQTAVHPHHCNFNDVGSGPLNRGIHCHPLAEGALHPIGGTQLRQRAAASEQRLCIALFLCLLNRVLQIGGNAAVGLFVVLDIGIGLLYRDSDIPREGKCADAVHDAEIDRLGAGAHLRRYKCLRQIKYLRCGAGVDIHALAECFDHCGIVCQCRQHPQLNLRIVGIDQQVALLRLKEIPHAAARLGANGNVLHVRLGAADASGSGIGLTEHRTDPAVCPDGILQSFHVGGGQLFVLTVLQYLAHDGVVGNQLLQHLGIGGIAALGLFLCRQLQLPEQHLAQLLGGIDIKLPARKGVDFLLQSSSQIVQIDAEFPQSLAVDAKARQFHRGKHLAERLLHLPQQLLLGVRFQLPLQHRGKLAQPHALPHQRQQLLRRLRRRKGKPLLCQLALHGVIAGVGVQQVARQAGIQP